MISDLVPFMVGTVLAVATGTLAELVGLARDKAFYPTLLIAIAGYYLLFAALSGDLAIIMSEAPGLLLFGTVAVTGFRRSPWMIVAGLYGHGIFDAVHGRLIPDPGVPGWWPPFCLGFDLVLGTWLGMCLVAPGSKRSRSGERLDQLAGGGWTPKDPLPDAAARATRRPARTGSGFKA